MKVGLFIFTYRPNGDAMQSVYSTIVNLYQRDHAVSFYTYGSALVHSSRNLALAAGVRQDVDALVFLDDDILLQASDIGNLLESLSDETPIVSGLCTTRGTPIAPGHVDLAPRWWSEKDRAFYHFDHLPQGRLVSPKKGDCFGVGAACLAVRRDAAEKLVQHYLSANDWLEDNRLMLDRLHVRLEHREAERQRVSEKRKALYEKESGYIRVFDYPCLENQRQVGEDIGFSIRCMQLGIPISIDTRITPGHIGDYPYGVWDFQSKLEREKVA